ncbi:MAG TPA: hypothetical protein VFI68_07280, partial [Anaerolineales bacterium]|nr:hypothetical protein [Anaerolineales bacterium]
MIKTRATKNANIEKTENGWRLGLQKGDSLSYRDAQLDDYSGLPRHKFPHRTLSLSLRAKTSSSSIAGTWGFGLWNDPFGFSPGFGGSPFRLPALPNAAWFFYGSEENYLSFADGGRVGRALFPPVSRPPIPANGFMAQTFRSPKFHPLLFPAGLTLPFSRRTTRKLLSRVIDEDGIALSVDVAQWHAYKLEWGPNRVHFYVDDAIVFESPVSPKPPLGTIIWID